MFHLGGGRGDIWGGGGEGRHLGQGEGETSGGVGRGRHLGGWGGGDIWGGGEGESMFTEMSLHLDERACTSAMCVCHHCQFMLSCAVHLVSMGLVSMANYVHGNLSMGDKVLSMFHVTVHASM